ncbi:MAG TPA: hypothetical protein VF718_00920 [Allosphingosinicella sp.]|jgi:hypothetical protein
MAKKAGTKILDDNGTLVTASADSRGAADRGADKGEASAKTGKRGSPGPSRG